MTETTADTSEARTGDGAIRVRRALISVAGS